MKVITYLLLEAAICRLLKINDLVEILIWPVTLAIVLIDKALEWVEINDNNKQGQNKYYKYGARHHNVYNRWWK